MRLLLIAPSSGPWRHVGRRRFFTGRTFRFSLLSLLSVAAATPPGVEIRLVDEQVEDIPWAETWDLVGITCMTALAPRAYEIAAAFRARRVPVVLGGMHPTLCPDEAIRHADAVVVGDAEGIWSRVVTDAASGQMSGTYRQPVAPDLRGLNRPPRHLLNRREYATVHAVQATRGCPHRCGFCAVSAFHAHTQRRRPIEEVIAEVLEIPGRWFIFGDDNLTADREYASALFRQLEALGKRWVTQSTLAIADDPDFVRLAARAGCMGIFAGLETFTPANLDAVNKTCHRVEEYRRSIQLLHRHGIGVEAGIVFGFDHDGPEVFAHTLRLLDDLGIDLIQASIFTPLPGTPAFEAMSDRILDRNWAHYDFHHVVFEPQRMSAEALQAGHDWVTREFYRPARMARRVAQCLRRPRGWFALPFVVAINAAYYGRVRAWHINGWNPDRPDPGRAVAPSTGRPRSGRGAWRIGVVRRAPVTGHA